MNQLLLAIIQTLLWVSIILLAKCSEFSVLVPIDVRYTLPYLITTSIFTLQFTKNRSDTFYCISVIWHISRQIIAQLMQIFILRLNNFHLVAMILSTPFGSSSKFVVSMAWLAITRICTLVVHGFIDVQ